MQPEKTILHDAFILAKDAYNAASHAEAKDVLHNKHPELEWDALVGYYERACSLTEAAYDYGDKCRLGWMTDDDAIDNMFRKYPGFDMTTYKANLSYGYFVSR